MWISSCHTGCCINLLVQYVGMDSFSCYTRGDDDDHDDHDGDDDVLITVVKIIIVVTAVGSQMHNSVHYN